METGSKVVRSTSLATAALRSARGALLAGALGSTACAAGDEQGWQEFEGRQSDITGGSAVTGTDLNGVVKMLFRGANNTCTATKIGQPTSTRVRFITAAHCIDTPPSNIDIINRNDGVFPNPPPTYTVNQSWRHPSAPVQFLTGLQTSYDFAIIDVNDDANGTLGSLPTEQMSLGWIMLPGDVGFFVGYGCDDGNTTDGRKERGDVVVSEPLSSENSVHNFFFRGASPRICEGDSGGPMFLQLSDGRRRIAGVNSGFNRNAGLEKSFWPRADNVFEWIQNPTRESDFTLAVGSTLFLANRGNPLEFCLVYDNPPSGSNTRLTDCDSATGIVSGKPSGWSLVTSPVGGFRIRNRNNITRCLGVAGASTALNAVVEAQPCAASTATDAVKRSQAWDFSSSGAVRTITNRNSNRCMAASTTSKGSTVVQGPVAPCSTTGASSVNGWEYYR